MVGSVSCSTIFTGQWSELSAEDLSIDSKTIAVWHGSTQQLMPFCDELYSTLSREEQIQASCYKIPHHRERYIVQHGVLRLLLSGYLNIPVNDLVLNFSPEKKPYLTSGGKQSCFFNLTASEGDFLIAIAAQEVGVDMEYCKPDLDYKAIVSEYFSTEEIKFINNATNPAEAFFLLWTRKEALVKAIGTGIDEDWPLLEAVNGLNRFLSNTGTHWLTESFKMEDGFVASITYPVPRKQVKFMSISVPGCKYLLGASL
jgi:4'-phosphopantetheinyl transferase